MTAAAGSTAATSSNTVVSGIGVAAPSAASQTSATDSLSQQDFLNILLTQLQFQDPLQPMDDEQFVAQLAQFSALEVNTQESSELNTLLTFESMNQGVSLIGQSVQVEDSQSSATAATTAAGTVTAVSFSSGQPLLTIQTSSNTLTDIPLSNVTLVQQSGSTGSDTGN